MTIDELKTALEGAGEWDWGPVEPNMEDDHGNPVHVGGDAIVVLNEGLQTAHVVEAEKIANMSLAQILATCSAGRDVNHITRVTGYFSKTSGWNKGKLAELKDRHRTSF